MKMILSLAVALLLGLATASKHTVKAVSGDYPDLLKLGDYFSFSTGYNMDISYSFEYVAGPYPYSDVPAQGFNFEEYSFNVQAEGTLYVTRELFSFDKETHTFKFTPFRITPAVGQIIWFRPEDTTGPFNLNFWLGRRMELLTLSTEVTENERTTLQSVIDYSQGTSDHLIPETAADWVYSDDDKVTYNDQWLAYDIGKTILPEDNILLGEHTWFNFWILDNVWSSW
jgi:hypothetical protein